MKKTILTAIVTAGSISAANAAVIIAADEIKGTYIELISTQVIMVCPLDLGVDGLFFKAY